LGQVDELHDHDHSVRLPAGRRPVGELGHFFANQLQILELALAYDLLLDVRGPLARPSFHLVTGRALQLFPGGLWQIFGQNV